MGHTLTLPSGWRKVRLGDLFVERNEINNTDLELLSITGTRGIIPRSDLEGKDNSNNDKSKYLKVCIGDIAYNTMRMWQGVSALSFYEGIVSPAYTVLVPLKETFAPYFSYLFKLRAMINIFYRNSQGLVDDQRSLKYHNFAQIMVTIPPLPEQKRIAEILIEQDKLIALKERLIVAKKKQKKWLMQNLLTGKIRLEGFNDKWKNTIFQRILVECKRLKGSEELEICSVAVNKGIINQIEHLGRSYAANNTENYHIVSYGDIVYTKSPTGDFPFGIVKQSQLVKTVAVSPLYGVFKPSNYFIGRFLDFYFQSHINSNNYLKKIVNKGAKNTILVNNADFLKGSLKIPNSEYEQQNIAERLSTADQEIELLTKELDAQKKVKKYLMQQLLTGKIRVTGGES